MPHKAISVMAKGDITNWELHRRFLCRPGRNGRNRPTDQGGNAGICGSTHFAHTPTYANVIYSPGGSLSRSWGPTPRRGSPRWLLVTSRNPGQRYSAAQVSGLYPGRSIALSSQIMKVRYANPAVSRIWGRFAAPPEAGSPMCTVALCRPDTMTNLENRTNYHLDMSIVGAISVPWRSFMSGLWRKPWQPDVDRKGSRSFLFEWVLVNAVRPVGWWTPTPPKRTLS
jgi:hypothetical protein